jgi:hypothetical protein
MNAFKIGISGALGGILCILADLAQKAEASAVLTIGHNLGMFLKIPYANILASVTIVAIATGLCFIFDVKTKQRAFYLGASILAIMMTLVPYNPPSSLSSIPHSVKVEVILETEDNRPIKEVTVTLLDSNNREIMGRSKFQDRSFYFYQPEGDYIMRIEVPGYRTVERELKLVEGEEIEPIRIKLNRSKLPIFIQRLLLR